MPAKKISETQINNYSERYFEFGEAGFIQWAVQVGVERFPSTSRTPDTDMLDMAEGFFSLFRRTGEDLHFTLGTLLRKSAHIIYRELKHHKRKDGMNRRFIQLIGNA